MPTFRAPRGTRDLLPDETPVWSRLERLAADDFAGFPRDALWFCSICLVAEACALLADDRRAAGI